MGEIRFNFPQCGNAFPGTEAWRADHRALLSGFFAASARLLAQRCPDGRVVLVLMDRAPYCDLPCAALAAETGLDVERRDRFEGGHLGLYRHRMTRFDKVVKADEDSTCHIFRLSACGGDAVQRSE